MPVAWAAPKQTRLFAVTDPPASTSSVPEPLTPTMSGLLGVLNDSDEPMPVTVSSPLPGLPSRRPPAVLSKRTVPPPSTVIVPVPEPPTTRPRAVPETVPLLIVPTFSAAP